MTNRVLRLVYDTSPHITVDDRFLYLFLGHNFDHDTPTHCTCQKKAGKGVEGRGGYDKKRCI